MKITQPKKCFRSLRQGQKKKMKQSVLDISKLRRVTIITFKEISVTSPSVQSPSHMLALTWGLETPHWVWG